MPALVRTLAVAVTLSTTASFADEIRYTAELTNCTTACDGFASIGPLPGESTFELVIGIDSNQEPPFEFVPGENGFIATLTDTEAPVVEIEFGPEPDCPPPNVAGQICNVDTANPLALNSFNNSAVEITGDAQVIDGVLTGGTLVVTYLREPLLRNDMQVAIDLATGAAQITFLDGGVLVAQYSGNAEFIADEDSDGVPDAQDNCQTLANPSQFDANDDGFGNACDQDLNGDCFVNSIDLGIFRANFFLVGVSEFDFNGDGVVAVVDLGIMRSRFFDKPGPSGVASCP